MNIFFPIIASSVHIEILIEHAVSKYPLHNYTQTFCNAQRRGDVFRKRHYATDDSLDRNTPSDVQSINNKSHESVFLTSWNSCILTVSSRMW